jgi:hypothetical protein
MRRHGLKGGRSDSILHDPVILRRLLVSKTPLSFACQLGATDALPAGVSDACQKVGAELFSWPHLSTKRRQNVGEGLGHGVLSLLRRSEDLAGNRDRDARMTPVQLLERAVVTSPETLHECLIGVLAFENIQRTVRNHGVSVLYLGISDGFMFHILSFRFPGDRLLKH